ncbi:hypothetical protein BL107_11251 [Synechococcus sp. BL107]|uniref:hypothetical protein n=1 Tax=Synechococcus sp. BL107 TaxID=313625 RepID=UPI0000E546AA|nr:hypothetical protein [Synechococcus sp. BL107]EAU70641.1 hypothetical protein BL107_11251 [Synechococcus sp. BL107]|tara:strand:- start:96 stop:299 length:204 start_codon:yes stop_codon:yes gene_type:complete
MAAAITARWPAWIPSKLPRANAVGRRASFGEQSGIKEVRAGRFDGKFERLTDRAWQIALIFSSCPLG